MSTLEPNAGCIDGREHLLPVRVYYEDTDFTGVVYHANYLRFFERGRSDFLRLAGIHHAQLAAGEAPMGFAVNKMNLEFHRPARIDDALVVRSAFESIRGPRFFAAQQIERAQSSGEERDILVTAKLEICCISLTGRPRKPPVTVLERLKPFLSPSASTF